MEEERHVFTCGITRDKIDITKIETVKIAGKDSEEKKFVVFCRIDAFFNKFVNHKDVPHPLPGLRKYYSRKYPLIRYTYNPTRFTGNWKASSVINELLKDKPAETPGLTD